jgi:hypothetical protein
MCKFCSHDARSLADFCPSISEVIIECQKHDDYQEFIKLLEYTGYVGHGRTSGKIETDLMSLSYLGLLGLLGLSSNKVDSEGDLLNLSRNVLKVA